MQMPRARSLEARRQVQHIFLIRVFWPVFEERITAFDALLEERL